MKHKLPVLFLLLITMVVASSISVVKPSLGQTKPPAPKFTVVYVPNATGVPPNYGIDMSTGKNVTMNGYQPTKRAVVFTIENPTVDRENVYYNFRFKLPFTDTWSYYPFNPDGQSVLSYSGYSWATGDLSPKYPASNSFYTNVSIALAGLSIRDVTNGSPVDFQVQALFGDIETIYTGLVAGNRYQFTGETSDWSSTQTVTIGEATVTTNTPPPSILPIAFNWEQFTILALVITVTFLVVAVAVLWRRTTPK